MRSDRLPYECLRLQRCTRETIDIRSVGGAELYFLFVVSTIPPQLNDFNQTIFISVLFG